MFENLFGKNQNVFGKIGAGMCRLTPNGSIAVKTSGGYKSYDIDRQRLTNQSNFVFDVGDDFFFVIPTNKVKAGDIILVHGKPVCVTSADNKEIKVIDYENSVVNIVVPERHVFMGNTYFYGKIVSLFGSNFKNKKGTTNMLKSMMQMQMMKSMMGDKMSFGGESGSATNTTGAVAGGTMGGMGNMMEMMMFMNMFGGGKGGFDMFDNMFDFGDDDDDETETIKKLMKEDEEDN